MADNLLKRLYNAAINKSHAYSLQGGKQTVLQLLGSSLKFLFGKANFDAFTEAYGKNPLVYMIVHKISFSSASIKRKAFDSNDNEIRKGQSQILELLENPNPEQGQIEFLEEINEYLSTTGNVFIRFIEGIGMGEELEILVAANVDIVCASTGTIIKYTYNNPLTGGRIDYAPEEILHIKSSNIVNTEGEEIKFGLSPLQAGWVVVESSNEKFNAEAWMFKNRGIIGFASTDSDVPMLDPERIRTQEAFDNAAGGSNKFNSIYVTNTKLKFTQTSMSPSDLKLLEGIVSSLRILCGIYGMPSQLFNDPASSTFNNVSEAKQTAFTDVYIPLANKIDASLSKFLSEKLKVEEIIKVDLTSIEVIKASTNEVAQALNNMSERLAVIAIQSLTDDEVRDLLTLGALTTDQVTIAQSAQIPADETGN